MKPQFGLSLILSGLSLQCATHANFITNGSFESPAQDATWIDGSPYGYFLPGAPTGWQTDASALVSTFAPSLVPYPSGVPNGNQVAALGFSGGTSPLFQDTSAVLTLGVTYSLTAYVGSRADFSGGVSSAGAGIVELLTADGDLLASVSVEPIPGTFDLVSLIYTPDANNPYLGETLRVQLERFSGTQANFDLVSLTAQGVSTVPEQSGSVAAFAAFFLAVGLMRRNRMAA